VLGLLGLSQPDRSPQLSPTTYGETPIGYGAVLAMLTQLGLPAGRTFAAADALPPESTVWWIEPEGLCRARTPAPGAPEVPWTGDAWLAGRRHGRRVPRMGIDRPVRRHRRRRGARPHEADARRPTTRRPNRPSTDRWSRAAHPAGAAAQ
jgi:hypothetical protein